MSARKYLLAFVTVVLSVGLQSVLADNVGTGGTITYTDSSGLNPVASPPYSDGYVVHTFTSSGTYSNSFAVSADVLAVAGGGGGGGGTAGGGGAGGLVYTNISLSSGDCPVTIGQGGAGGNQSDPTERGANGTSSTLGALVTAYGGGGGGSNYGSASDADGRAGGSGGGGSLTSGAGTGGTNTYGQGNVGGNMEAGWPAWRCGGGGGAGTPGTNSSNSVLGHGGAGLSSDISGTTKWYAGGGGGGVYNENPGGSGGQGGGGNGGANGLLATSADPNTGGGGGGQGQNNSANAGAGGSGIVIIRYPYSAGSVSVIVTSPTDGQEFLSGSSVTATVAVLGGETNYNVTFYTNSVEAWSTNNSSTNLFNIDLGALADGTYTNYATVTDGLSSNAVSVTNSFIVAPDTTPPTPDPMEFAVAPASVDTNMIVMTASTATDTDSPPVLYYFECTNDSANSGWISSTVWTNTGLTKGTTYGYRVRARDSATPSSNVTAYSDVFTAVPGETTLSTGGANSWNTGTWSAGVPAGTIDASVAAGVEADANSGSTPSYTGSLTLNSGSKLTIQNTGGSENAMGTGPITLDGATLEIHRSDHLTIPALALASDGLVDLLGVSNKDRTFNGAITGTGELTVKGQNGLYLYFATSNSVSGGLVLDASAGRCEAFFQTAGAAGVGDVTVIPSGGGAYCWISVQASDVFADSAKLTLDGTPGANGGMRSSSGSEFLRMGNYNDTIDSLTVQGIDQPPGDYGREGHGAVDFEVAWISGNGVLTVLNGPADETPPTVDFTAIDSNGGSGPVYVGEPVTYTITFSEAHTPDLTASGLENAVAAGMSVESFTKNSTLEYTAVIEATEAGALQLQISAAIEDLSSNPLATPATDNQTFTVDEAPLLVGQLGVWLPWANSRTNPATGSAWKAGDQYRLALVTSSGRTPDEADISVYNTFVQTSAESSTTYTNLGDVTWNVIGSTSSIDAKVNTGTDGAGGVSVVLMDGATIMAADNADLWDGTSQLAAGPYAGDYAAPLFDQNGVYRNTWVWTGSNTDGTKYTDRCLGTAASSNVRRGKTGPGENSSSAHWINRAEAGKTTSYSFYGLSEPLTLQSYDLPPVTVSVTAPTNTQEFLSGSSVTATVEVAEGEAPYDVTFYTNSAVAWSTNDSPDSVFTIDLGMLADGTYTNYATVTDNLSSNAVSVTNTFTVAPDTTPPTPSPMGFAVAPASLAADMIVMTASNATDTVSPPVYYYFVNTTNGTNSGWISSTVWTNTGLTEGTTYGYKVRARDSATPSSNVTAYSDVFTAVPSGLTTILSTGGSDSWNTGTWSMGVPAGTVDAIVAAGVQADANNALTPAYTGSLTLSSGSKLRIANTAGSENAMGSGPITLNASTLEIDRAAHLTIPSLGLAGSGTVDCSGTSNLDRNFNGTISGTGELTVKGQNGMYLYFTTSNTVSGGLVLDASAGRCEAFLQTAGAAGAGDVTVIPSGGGAYCWIRLAASDMFADSATLTLDGTPGANGNMRSSSGSEFLRMGNYSDTIDSITVQGIDQPPGDYGREGHGAVDFEVAWISGNGVLTVLNGPSDETPPTVGFTAFDANGGSGPVYVGEPVTYTITFSEAHTPDLTAGDLTNALAAGMSVESLTKNSALEYTAVIEATEAGALQLEIKSGAAIEDLSGNPLATPATDDQTFTVNRAPFLAGQLGVWQPWANDRINPATGSAWKAGDQYRLALVTSSSRNATETEISVYNAFVQSAAASSTTYTNLGDVTWKVIGSTSSIDAKVNTGTDGAGGVPVILMDGATTMASDNADLWNGTSQLAGGLYAGDYAAPLFDQNGVYRDVWVWTGSNTDGTKYTDRHLGTLESNVRRGYTGGGNNTSSAHWINRAEAGKTTSYSFYGLSETLTLPAPATLFKFR